MMRKIKPETMKEAYGPMGESSDKAVILPTVCFDNHTLTEGKDWDVGKVYRVTLDLRMTGISQRKGRDGVERGHYDFDITGIDPTGEAPKAKKTRYV